MSGQRPSICLRRPLCRLKAPLGLSLLRKCGHSKREIKNDFSAEDAQSNAEGIPNHFLCKKPAGHRCTAGFGFYSLLCLGLGLCLSLGFQQIAERDIIFKCCIRHSVITCHIQRFDMHNAFHLDPVFLHGSTFHIYFSLAVDQLQDRACMLYLSLFRHTAFAAVAQQHMTETSILDICPYLIVRAIYILNNRNLLLFIQLDAQIQHQLHGKTSFFPVQIRRSVERLAALAAGVMRKGSICVTAPEQPKAVLSELIVAAGKCGCELVVPDPEDITFLEAEKFASKVDYGGYTVPLAFLGRHAAGNAAVAVELSLALCRKDFDITDEAILEGLAAVENRSSIRVVSQRPLVILDACRTPQQAAALLRVLNMAKGRHMSAIIGLTEEKGAEAFFSALETGLTPEEQKKDKSTMPGMSENPFDKVYLVTPQGTDTALTERLTEKAKYHFDAELCATLAEAVRLAHANTRRGLLVCGSEAAALEAAELLANS